MNRRISIMMMVAALAVGLMICRQLSIRAAPDREHEAKVSTIYLSDPHLIRDNEEAKRLRKEVDAAKQKGFDRGYHSCCINPPCSWCLLHLGQCSCVMGVATGHYACRECHGGWEANQGKVPGKTKADVRKMKTITSDFASEQAEMTAPEADQAKPSVIGDKNGSLSVDTQAAAEGEKIYDGNTCQSCHKMNGQGGEGGPDLTHEATRHADVAWQIEHLKAPQTVHPGSTMPSFAKLPPDQLKALASYLSTRK